MSDRFIIEVSPQEHSNVRELVVSYLRAVERFRAADARSSDREDQLQVQSLGRSALAEALSWADALDQYLRVGPKDTPRDPDWASGLAPDDQALVQAFQRVRNVVHHRWWEAVGVRLQPGASGQLNTWFWGDLPATRRDVRREGQGRRRRHRL